MKVYAMNKPMALLLTALAALAGLAWWFADTNREPGDRTAVVDTSQATVDRVLRRTARESQAGVEATAVTSPGTFVATRTNDAQSSEASPSSELNDLPDGYSLGAYHGLMRRAPLSGSVEPELPQIPLWLNTAFAPGAILAQAAASGREFTFAILRPAPRTRPQDLHQSLAALGVRIEGMSGEYARVRVPAERSRLESIARLPEVLGLGVLPPEYKIEEAFAQELESSSTGDSIPVFITLMGADSTGEWRQALAGLGVIVGAYDADLRSYTANLPAAALMSVLAADFVMTVEPVPVVRANHGSAVPVMGADELRQFEPAMERFTGVTGAGIAVGVLDTGLNAQHMDISYGRTSICGASFVMDEGWDLWIDLHGHGTHVFGTIAGAGRADSLLAGMAPSVSHLRFGKVLSSYGSGSTDDIRRGMDYLARPSGCVWQGESGDAVKPLIVNMSLSATNLAFSGRGVGERKLDAVVYAHSQLYVVAQSNAGQHGFSNYGTAKNSLAVGAAEDSGIIAWFSSHGPTADGRLAPGVVGTGVGLTSARGSASRAGYNTLSGTSMAAPAVAGVAALLMEARPEFQDQPALTRARLMASAIRPHAYLETRGQLPVDNTDGPGDFNNLYGLGLVSARTSLYSKDEAEGWLIGSASAQPESDTYEYIDIEVPENAGRLDIVLTWDESPADTLTRSVLSNLDMWADQGADCGDGACGEHASRSEIDNVEWLLIEDPEPGVYRIKVVPVKTYGEPPSAAVAWKIARGEARPQLDLDVALASSSDDGSAYLTVDVTIESSGYVASGTTIHLGCRAPEPRDCSSLDRAYLPHRSRVFRRDGLDRPVPSSWNAESRAISVGEVAVGAPRRVQLIFLREDIPAGGVLHVTASSWNAAAASASIQLTEDESTPDADATAPANDSFAAAERLSGTSEQTNLDLALASREPAEPLVSANSRTAWYVWEAPEEGLFRIRVQEADSGSPASVDMNLFTGDALTALEQVTEKHGSEITFVAKTGTSYKLRVASDAWDLVPLVLGWESADSRPAHDDFAFAHQIEGESGSHSSTNEGATLERQEFLGGYAATVWYKWTAPVDGFVNFTMDAEALEILAFAGSGLGGLRLVSDTGSVWNSSLQRSVKSVTFAIQEGATYHVVVASADADASGAPFTLEWETSDDDPRSDSRCNDRFEDAIPLDGLEGIALDPERCGRGYFTVEPQEPPETGIATAWWHWTAPRDGRFTWRMDGLSDAFQLSIFTGGALDNLEFVGSLRGGSALVLEAAGNTQYWIAFGRASDALVNRSFQQSSAIAWGTTPANDDRADAIRISGGSGSVDGSLGYATAEADEPRKTVGLESVWWDWVAPTSGWHRFWVEGHPLHAIVEIHPASGTSAEPTWTIATSERSFLANGRVETHLLARAGTRYDIRWSRRPDIDQEPSATLRWAESAAPVQLAYKGAVTEASLLADPVFDRTFSPENLAMTGDGEHLFSTSAHHVYSFSRDTETGDIALLHRTDNESDLDRGYRLWWSPLHERLFATAPCFRGHSIELPESGLLLSHQELDDFADRFRTNNRLTCDFSPILGDPDGRYLYALRSNYSRSNESLLVMRADSPTELTLVQTVSASNASGEDFTMVENLTGLNDMTLSPDGSYLYLAVENGLFVFSRDASSGKLESVREMLRSDADHERAFRQMGSLRNVALDANGTVLFLSGPNSTSAWPPPVSDTVFTAFDISTDPSNPKHLGTLTEFSFESKLDTSDARSHLRPRPRALQNCERLMAHSDLPAVDVFCGEGYYVVRWNVEAGALEVSDFAISGSDDRFGNTVPQLRANGQAAQSSDGAHVYRATNYTNNSGSDAIHVFERASAMKPE